MIKLKIDTIKDVLVDKVYRYCVLYLKNKKRINSKNVYLPLIPIDDAEEIDEYCNALEQALSNSKINNIAVSGPFSSGKSSFLESFEKIYPKDWKYLKISLATFFSSEKTPNDDCPSKKPNGNEKLNECSIPKNRDESVDDLLESQVFEKRILKQLFYQADTKKIPLSRIGKISDLNKWKILGKAFVIFYFVFFLIYLIKPAYFQKLPILNDYVNCSNLELWYCKFSNWIPIIILISWMLFIVVSFIITYLLVRYLQKNTVISVNVTKGEINTKQIDDIHSSFDANLDEILYFFKKHDFNVVIIEDLDRFPSHEIFVKFRELNNLLNSPKNLNNKNHKINFIYAIGDDVLGSKDRVKFFDLMIPILPYINPSNSYNKILEYFENEELDLDFLSACAAYIHDLRLLKNIYNEFKIYESNIFQKGVDKNKLLAMIIYKNFWPEDFVKLHKSKGIVYDIFNNRKKHILLETSCLESKISLVEDKIDERKDFFDNECKYKINELRTIYYFALLKKLNCSFHIQGKRYTWDTEINTASFDSIKNADEINNRHNHSTDIIFETIENEINSNLTYDDRVNKIREKEDRKLSELKHKRDKLNVKLSNLNSLTIQGIVETKNSAQIVFHGGCVDKPLLKYLIRNGFINEAYHTYISYFFKNSITENDNAFLLSISNDTPKAVNFSLGNIDELIRKKRLNQSSFESDAILNNDLFRYLIENKNNNNELFLYFIKKISDESNTSIDFVFSFIDENSDLNSEFLPELIQNWENFWVCFSQQNPSNSKKDKYIRMILKNLNVSLIKSINKDRIFDGEIDNVPNINIFDGLDISHCEDVFQQLEVSFKSLSYFEDKEVLQLVYDKSMYHLTPNNIEFILLALFDSEIPDLKTNLNNSHLTTIQMFQLEPLLSYINENIEKYINDVFTKIESNTKESIETIIELLNNDDKKLNNDIKKNIIKQSDFILEDINSVVTNIWSDLLENDKIDVNWSNLAYYFNEIGGSDSFIKFLKTHCFKLKTKEFIGTSKDDETELYLNELAKFIYELNSLNDEIYTVLLSQMPDNLENIDLEELSQSKVILLLEHQKLILSNRYYDLLKENFIDDLHLTLINNHFDGFIEKSDTYSVSNEELIKLLQGIDLTTNQILSILKLIDKDSLDEEIAREFSDSILSLLDVHKIILNATLSFCFKHLDDSDKKIKLLINQLNNLESDEITSYLKQLPKPYLRLSIKGRKQPKIPKSQLNKELLQELTKRGYIRGFKEEKNKIFGSKNFNVSRYY